MLTYIFTSKQRQIFSDSESLPKLVNNHWRKILFNPFYASMSIRIDAMERWLSERKIYHFELDNYSVVSRNETRFNGLICGVLALLYLGSEKLTEVDVFRQKYMSTNPLDRN